MTDNRTLQGTYGAQLVRTASLRPDFTDVVTAVTSDFDSLEWIVGSLTLVSRSRHKFFDSVNRTHGEEFLYPPYTRPLRVF